MGKRSARELRAMTSRLKKVEKRLGEFAQWAPLRERVARAVLATMPGVLLLVIDAVLRDGRA